ncbi:MAG: MotA/TolQ/ExbB proton channel family protein [Treponema sp.]|nr:MotA/TolQ/ExbB proton channel family protein [Treponema sp.]
MFSLTRAGGIFMIPIILAGAAVVFIVTERLLYFRDVKRRDSVFIRKLEEALLRHDFSQAESVCISAETPLSSVIKIAIQYRRLNESDMREIIQGELDESALNYERRISYIAVLANIATLLGLLGTVVGNIQAFGVMGSGGINSNPALLASSIATSLLTTAGGLFVSIPALIFHNYLVQKADRLINQMEKTVSQFSIRLTGRMY